MNKEIGNVSVISAKEIYVTENTAEAKEILILKIRAVAPLSDADDYLVIALGNEIGNVELGLKVRTLGHSHVLSVYLDLKIRAYTLKYEICFSAARYAEASAVDSHGIFGNDLGWTEGIGIVYVSILTVVIAVYLPAGRHGYFVVKGGLVDLVLIFEKAEIPLAVKAYVSFVFRKISSERLLLRGLRNIICSLGTSSLALQRGIFIFFNFTCSHFVTSVPLSR